MAEVLDDKLKQRMRATYIVGELYFSLALFPLFYIFDKYIQIVAA